MLIVYTYNGCGTCKKAEAWLTLHGIQAEIRPIRETPPSMDELRFGLKCYEGKVAKLFNSSGQTYRQLGLKDLLPLLSEKEQLEMMESEGNLVKRPFLVDMKKGYALVGFKEAEWKDTLVE